MLQPIQKDHESCCPNCGCVLARIEEISAEKNNEDTMESSIDIILLGSALNKNVKYSQPRSAQQYYEERALKHLENICKKFDIPERLAIEAFKVLQKKKRGFRSENEPVKQLIKILQKDENYLFIHKLKAIKARYEEIINC